MTRNRDAPASGSANETHARAQRTASSLVDDATPPTAPRRFQLPWRWGWVLATRARFASGLDWINIRFNKPWVWPAVGTVLAGALMAVAFQPAWWLWRVVLFGLAVVSGLVGVWGNTRRDVTVTNLKQEVARLLEENEQLEGEVVVGRQTVEETRQSLDTLVGQLIKRHCVQGDLTDQERITWVLVSRTQLRVVGRGCHDGRLETVRTREYGRNHGLMGRAATSRTTQKEVFDPAGEQSWEQWQSKTCRLGASDRAASLTMRSRAYLVVPILAPDQLSTMGVVVLESLTADTSRLEVVRALLMKKDVADTVRDVLSVLAQVPAPDERERE